MLIETPRLILREYTPDDFSSIYKVLSDCEIMQHYPYAFAITREEWKKITAENNTFHNENLFCCRFR